MQKSSLKIGIIGGTFDPIHYGHLILAENARDQFGLNLVYFIPTGNSPHKDNDSITSDIHRCRMIEAAISGNSNFKLSKMEIEDPEVSYTYRTLEKLNETHPNDQFYFILGGDSIAYLKDWVHPELICKYASIIVGARDDVEAESLKAYIKEVEELFSANVYVISAPAFDVSSHQIRERVKQGISNRYLIPEKVEDYIRENHLYG